MRLQCVLPGPTPLLVTSFVAVVGILLSENVAFASESPPRRLQRLQPFRVMQDDESLSHRKILRSLQRLDGWVQIGEDIDGEAQDDQSGWSVSLSYDGLTVAVGATHNDDGGAQSGHTRVWRRPSPSSDEWIHMGEDIDGEEPGNLSGMSISLSGDGLSLAIGTSEDSNAGGRYAGVTRIFVWDSGTGNWAQRGQKLEGESENEYSGHSVSISSTGHRVAIGSPLNSDNGITYGGQVRIYEWNLEENDQWDQLGSPGDIKGDTDHDQSGFDVELSDDGTTVVTGAYKNSPSSELVEAGSVQVYKFNDVSKQWVQLGGDIDGEAPGDMSGKSVSINSNGTLVAVGAWYNDDGGSDSGHVRVFSYSVDASAWTQLGQDLDGEAEGDNFSKDVQISPDGLTVVVGARFNDGGGTDAGHVRVFRFDPSLNSTGYNEGMWVQMGEDIDGEAAGDQFGRSVSVSADGNIVAVGAFRNDNGGRVDAGKVRIYEFAYDPWKVEYKQNSIAADINSDDPTKGQEITLMILTGRDANRIALSLFRDNCTTPVDGDAGQEGALIIASGIASNNTSLTEDVFGYQEKQAFLEINTTALAAHPIWVGNGPTGEAIFCARIDLYHNGEDGVSDTQDDKMVSFREVLFVLSADLSNKAFSVSASTDRKEIVQGGLETLSGTYGVDACFCTGGFTCDAEDPILRQNSKVEVCLTPSSTDTEIRLFSMYLTQDGNDSPFFPFPSVVENVVGALTTVTSFNDTIKVMARLLGVFFDQPDPLPPIRVEGTTDLELKISQTTRRRVQGEKAIDLGAAHRRQQEDNIFLDDAATTKQGGDQDLEFSKFSLSIDIIRASRDVIGSPDGFTTNNDDGMTYSLGDNGHYQGYSADSAGVAMRVSAAVVAGFVALALL